jgi:hypothetical protein
MQFDRGLDRSGRTFKTSCPVRCSPPPNGRAWRARRLGRPERAARVSVGSMARAATPPRATRRSVPQDAPNAQGSAGAPCVQRRRPLAPASWRELGATDAESAFGTWSALAGSSCSIVCRHRNGAGFIFPGGRDGKGPTIGRPLSAGTVMISVGQAQRVLALMTLCATLAITVWLFGHW